ncbi:antimicrobial ginkbilobin-2-like protein [Bidens hawaiensis]|uniref:antimicrobial ginkbilobin-2-like protein n=1 Tax=Bidens hawaiensis TaxID=980011 RepID=UPI004049700E
MVRYSTGRKILSVLDDWAWYSFPYPDDVNAIALEKTMDSLASKLKEEATTGDFLHKYARGTINYDGDENKLFVAVQCTPNISKEDCIKCLSEASNEIRSCCTRKLLFEGRVVSTNCFVRYSHVSFFDAPERFSDEYCD